MESRGCKITITSRQEILAEGSEIVSLTETAKLINKIKHVSEKMVVHQTTTLLEQYLCNKVIKLFIEVPSATYS